MPRSTTLRTGTSGSSTSLRTAQYFSCAVIGSPLGARIRSGDNLHLCEQVPEVFGVPSLPAPALHEAVLGHVQGRSFQDPGHFLVPRITQHAPIDANPLVDHGA